MISSTCVITPALWKHRLKQQRCYSITVGAFMLWGLQIEDVFTSCTAIDLLAEICSVGQLFGQEWHCYPLSSARRVLPWVCGPARTPCSSARTACYLLQTGWSVVPSCCRPVRFSFICPEEHFCNSTILILLYLCSWNGFVAAYVSKAKYQS